MGEPTVVITIAPAGAPTSERLDVAPLTRRHWDWMIWAAVALAWLAPSPLRLFLSRWLRFDALDLRG